MAVQRASAGKGGLAAWRGEWRESRCPHDVHPRHASVCMHCHGQMGRKQTGGEGGRGSHRLGDKLGDDPSASIDQHAIVSSQLQIPQQHDLCAYLPVTHQLELQTHMRTDRHAGLAHSAAPHVNAEGQHCMELIYAATITALPILWEQSTHRAQVACGVQELCSV